MLSPLLTVGSFFKLVSSQVQWPSSRAAAELEASKIFTSVTNAHHEVHQSNNSLLAKISAVTHKMMIEQEIPARPGKMVAQYRSH